MRIRTRWEGNVLVYNGAIEGPVEHGLRQAREQRIQNLRRPVQS